MESKYIMDEIDSMFEDDEFIMYEPRASKEEHKEKVDLSAIQYKPKPEIKKEPKKPKVEKVDKRIIKHQKKESLTEEEIIEKRRLILLIQFYIIEFPDKLKVFKRVKLEKKSIEELTELRKEIDFIISNKSNVRAGVQLISTSIQTLEFFLLNFTPVNATGLSNICNDKDTIDDMKHIALKHCHLISSEPEARLMYKILTTTLLLHNINTNVDINNPNIDKINKEFVDI